MESIKQSPAYLEPTVIEAPQHFLKPGSFALNAPIRLAFKGVAGIFYTFKLYAALFDVRDSLFTFCLVAFFGAKPL